LPTDVVEGTNRGRAMLVDQYDVVAELRLDRAYGGPHRRRHHGIFERRVHGAEAETAEIAAAAGRAVRAVLGGQRGEVRAAFEVGHELRRQRLVFDQDVAGAERLHLGQVRALRKVPDRHGVVAHGDVRIDGGHELVEDVALFDHGAQAAFVAEAGVDQGLLVRLAFRYAVTDAVDGRLHGRLVGLEAASARFDQEHVLLRALPEVDGQERAYLLGVRFVVRHALLGGHAARGDVEAPAQVAPAFDGRTDRQEHGVGVTGRRRVLSERRAGEEQGERA